KLTDIYLSTEKGKTARASGEVALNNWQPGAIRADVSGEISPRLFQWLLPEQVADASGSIRLDVHIGGQWSRPQWNGLAEVKNLVFRARRLERVLKLDGGTIALNNFDLNIGCP